MHRREREGFGLYIPTEWVDIFARVKIKARPPKKLSVLNNLLLPPSPPPSLTPRFLDPFLSSSVFQILKKKKKKILTRVCS